MKNVRTWLLSHKLLSLLVVIALVGAVSHFLTTKPEDSILNSADRAVRVASVAQLSETIAPLPLIGTVSSRNEANIRAESSGKLVGVYAHLGQYVSAGDVIAEFENSTEKASVLQAEGAYEAARAGRDIAEINTGTANTSLEDAKLSALNTITSVYATLDDAIRTKTDSMYANPQGREAKLLPAISDEKLVISVTSEHANVEQLLANRALRNDTLSVSSDLVTELDTIFSETGTVKQYLDDLSLALSRAIPDQNVSQATITGYQTSVGLARSAVSLALTTISGAKSSLNGSIAASAVAQKNFGGNTSNNATADANVKAALGTLSAAQARLEKTIIRSPISGTINSLSVETGDFIPPYSDIAVVSNNGALEVIAYATDDDAKVLSIGNKVTIDDTAKGVITRIAPAVDPKTKKIEVRIGIKSGVSTLTNGQSVRISVERDVPDPKKNVTSGSSVVRIPLSALKITPTGAVVFTVSASSTLIAHTVTEGALLGEKVEITDGLSPDMKIVTDARGLKEDMTVEVVP